VPRLPWKRTPCRRRAALVGLAAALLVVSSGCANRPAASHGPAPPDPLRGTTNATLLPDPAARGAELEEDEEYRPPAIRGENRLPLYPEEALAAHCGDGIVALRIVIGTEGDVIDVSDSPLLDSTGGGCGADFHASAASAVRAWRFWPAEKRRLAPGEDYDKDGSPDYEKVLETTPLPVYLDIRFDFEVVEGVGRVRTHAPGIHQDQ
jgi:hypothetical protein